MNSDLAYEVYQVVGSLAARAGVFEDEQVQRVLDNLIAAAEGRALPHETVLPFSL